jgi:hypothetical protein
MAGADFGAARLAERELGAFSTIIGRAAKRKITVAYIPSHVPAHLPVTDYISKLSDNGEIFSASLVSGVSRKSRKR